MLIGMIWAESHSEPPGFDARLGKRMQRASVTLHCSE
jgi:hypothetical protein